MVEIIPKETAPKPNWLNILFYFSLILLIAGIIDFFILKNANTKAEEALKKIDLALAEEKSAEKFALKKEILQYQEKINQFSSLVEKHRENSPVFELLEKFTHPKVWFSQFSLGADNRVILSGVAENFTALAQQQAIFKGAEFAVEAKITKISLSKDARVDFGLELFLDPAIFSPWQETKPAEAL